MFNKFSDGRDHLLRRMKLMGHEVQDFIIKPFRLPSPYLAYASGILFSPIRFRKIKPDLILADDIEPAVASLLLRWVFNIPFVFNFVDDYSLIASYSEGTLKNIRIYGLKCLEKIIPKLADMVIAVNLEINRFCSNIGVPELKLSIVPNGVDTALFRPDTKSGEMEADFGLHGYQVILFVGKLNRYYKLETILEAVPLVLECCPNTKFLFVGDGDNVNRLKDLSYQLKIEQSVIFAGFRPPEEIPRIINLSDICVFPLPASSALAIFEYMACARPVVLPTGGTEKMGISEEMLPENCVLRVEHSPEGFAQGIKFLLRNEDIAKEMGRKARELTVRSYDWNILVWRYEKALRQVLERE